MNAAARMISEAARLKQLLPAPDDRSQYYEMTREEWLATFAPKPTEPG
jgi:hypothetical protein